MEKNDPSGLRPGDLAVALSLLSRLPVHLPPEAYQRGAAAAWAYPLVGVVLGGLSGLAALALSGVDAGLAALAAIGVGVILSGAMHEDGLADVADGFWGGWDRARRLEIMKDSQIGTYGVMALVLGFAGRWWALSLLFGAGHVLSVTLAVAVMSRAGMPALMAALPHARDGGLSRSVGRPRAWRAGLAAGIAMLTGMALLGAAALLAGLMCALCVGGLAGLARAKIGGQTGDVLGASQQLCELGMLVVLVAVLV